MVKIIEDGVELTPEQADAAMRAPGKRWVEYMPLDGVLPALKNPKDHDDAIIAGSISQFGYIEPIVLDERTGRLVAGHGRTADLQRRRSAGEDPPDGITAAEDGTWLVPVARGWSSTSDDQAHAAGIAINQGTIAGGFKRDELAEMLAELQLGGALEGTGFNDSDLDDMLASLGDEMILDPQPSDADYAGQTKRGEPAEPREVQGLREVGLIFQAEHHREYLELLARLRHAYGEDAAPLVVLRAMRDAQSMIDDE